MSDETPHPTAELYAKANVANIVKKLKAGRTLTTAERKALDDYENRNSDEEWVKDTTALARELGLARKSIYEARERFPDAPAKHADGKRENLKAWREFCATNLIGKDTATKTLAELKAELMRREIRLRDIKIQREGGKLVSREVVEDLLGLLAQKLDLLLRLKLEVELGPRCAGKDAGEINHEGSQILDEIREVVNSNLASFEATAISKTQRSESDDDKAE